MQHRSAALPAFEETRPAPYWAAAHTATATGPAHGWSTATLAPAAPLPQDAWLIDLPEVDPEPVQRRESGAWRWPRIAGLASAALLTLFALGLAASLLDGQRALGAETGMRYSASARS
jgi:hypothetical protein